MLEQQKRAHAKEDPPPYKVKPIPIQLIQHTVQRLQTDEFSKAIADLIIIGFFYLLRPDEHVYSSDNNHPFRLQDVSFDIPDIDQCTTNAAIADLAALEHAAKVHLNFTTQKNMEKDEAISHGDTSDPLVSPLKAIRHRVEHLRNVNASIETPLHTVMLSNGTI